jgi:hypothetical protein
MIGVCAASCRAHTIEIYHVISGAVCQVKMGRVCSDGGHGDHVEATIKCKVIRITPPLHSI